MQRVTKPNDVDCGTRSTAHREPFLPEYLALCRVSRMRPLIGVNYNCHRYQKCNQTPSESIARAERQVQFAVDKGFEGAFWYIGKAPPYTVHKSYCR